MNQLLFHKTVILSLSKDLCLFRFVGAFTDLSTSLRYGRDDNPFYDARPVGVHEELVEGSLSFGPLVTKLQLGNARYCK